MGALIQRVLTALLAIPAVLALTFWHPALPFKAAVLVALFLGFLEYCRMVELRGFQALMLPGSFTLLLTLLPFFLPTGTPFQMREALVLGLLSFFPVFLGSRSPLSGMAASTGFAFLGAAYFGVLGGYFLVLKDLENGAWHLLWVFVATWAYDTGAYAVGKRWGRRKMAPEVSPQKTWEGGGGGVLFCLGALFLLWKTVPFYASYFSLGDVAVLSILFSLFGQLGDLAESMLKRSLSAKDSGTFFPGHGGIFDRIDSLLFNGPVLFYYLTVIKGLHANP